MSPTTPGALFEERQRPQVALVVAVVAVVAAAAAIAVAASSRDVEVLMRLLLVPVLSVAVGLALVSMRTVVTHDHVRVTIVPFPRKTFPLSEIARCEPVTYRPLWEYGGWGWRWSLRRGPAYTMRGNRGVMIHRRNGKTFLVGSQRPEELAAAIESVAGGSARPGRR